MLRFGGGIKFYSFILALNTLICDGLELPVMRIVGMCRALLGLLALLLSLHVSSQDELLLELEFEANNTLSDTSRLRLFNELSLAYSTVDPYKGIEYGFDALSVATKLKDASEISWSNANIARSYENLNSGDSALKYIRRSYQLISQNEAVKFKFAVLVLYGNAFMDIPDYDSAGFYYTKALDIALLTGNKTRLGAAYNNLANINHNNGNLQKSYEQYLLALNNFEATGDIKNQAIALNNIALINKDLGHFESSVKYLLKAVEVNKSIGDNYNLSMNYTNIGVSYKEMEDYDLAFEYYDKSIAIALEFGFYADLARNYHNIGNIYKINGNTDLALASYENSTEISRKQGLKIGILYNNLAICRILVEEGEIAEAKEVLAETHDLIDETGQILFKENYFYLMSVIAEKGGDFPNSLLYYKKHTSFKDSISELENRRQIEEIQQKYETEKKAIENQRLRDINQVSARVIQNQRGIGAIVIVSMILAIIYAVSIFRSRRKLNLAYKSLKDLNNKVLVQKQELERTNQTKDKMFSIIAHDLKSPFNAMIGFMELMMDDRQDFDDKEKAEMLRMTYDQSITTFGLLENLLQWSLAQRDMIEYNPVTTNLFSLIDSQVDLLVQRASNKNLGIENKVNTSAHSLIDENMTNTIFRNLIGNAIKFTSKNGKIWLKSDEVDGKVIVKVIDNGIGMPENMVKDLLLDNQVQSRLGTDNESGTGLGLEIVKDFTRRMQVEMQIESKEGEGSVFTLVFPSASDNNLDSPFLS